MLEVRSIELKANASSTPKRRTEPTDEDKEDLPKKQKTESVDADTNTVNSGESFQLYELSPSEIKILDEVDAEFDGRDSGDRNSGLRFRYW